MLCKTSSMMSSTFRMLRTVLALRAFFSFQVASFLRWGFQPNDGCGWNHALCSSKETFLHDAYLGILKFYDCQVVEFAGSV